MLRVEVAKAQKEGQAPFVSLLLVHLYSGHDLSCRDCFMPCRGLLSQHGIDDSAETAKRTACCAASQLPLCRFRGTTVAHRPWCCCLSCERFKKVLPKGFLVNEPAAI